MRNIFILLLLIFILFNLKLYCLDFLNIVQPAELVFYYPSFNNFIEDITILMNRFYGQNRVQKKVNLRTKFKNDYGLDFFDKLEMKNRGFDTEKPFIYILNKNNIPLLYFPILSKEKVEDYIIEFLDDSINYTFVSNYIIIAGKKEALNHTTANFFMTEYFINAKNTLKLDFKKPFLFLKNQQLNKLNKIDNYNYDDQRYYMITIEITNKLINLNFYFSDLTERFVNTLININNVSNKQNSYDFFDHLWDINTLFINLNYNLFHLFSYINKVDDSDIFKLKNFSQNINSILDDNLFQRILKLSDGKLKIVVNKYNITSLTDYIAVISLSDIKEFNTIINEIKSKHSLSDNFQIFNLYTREFYQFKNNSINIYFGLINNELYFSPKKEYIVRLVDNFYQEINGYSKSLPDIIFNANSKNTKGFYAFLNAQKFFFESRNKFDFIKDYIIGIKTIELSININNENKPEGWLGKIKIEFFNE